MVTYPDTFRFVRNESYQRPMCKRIITKVDGKVSRIVVEIV